MYDPITALRDAGFPVDQLTEAQRKVLAALSEQETNLLTAVQSRLREAEGDVVAHDLKLL